MASVYINPDWTGTESGTKAEPYYSLESMKADIGYSSGLIVYIKEDTDQTLTAVHIINATNVTISSYNDNENGVDAGSGKRPRIQAASGAIGLQIGQANASGITLQYIEVIGSATSSRCIYMYGPDLTDTKDSINALIEYCDVHESTLNNIRIYASDAEIRYCNIYNSDEDNVFIGGGNNIHIHHNNIYGTGLGGSQGDNIQVAAVTSCFADDCLIEYNTCENISGIKHNIIAPGNISSVRGIIRHNTCYCNSDVSINIHGISTQCYGNKIISYGNNTKTCIISMTTSKAVTPHFYGNLIIDSSTDITADGWEALIFTNCDGSVIANNIIKTTNTAANLAGIRFNTVATTDGKAVNNILIGMDLGVTQDSTAPNTESNNCYFNIGSVNHANELTYASLGTANAIESDPLLDSNYYPKANSPCYHAGTFVGFWFKDIDGRRFHIPPTIGCKEFTSRSPARTRTTAVIRTDYRYTSIVGDAIVGFSIIGN